jgi:membrane protein
MTSQPISTAFANPPAGEPPAPHSSVANAAAFASAEFSRLQRYAKAFKRFPYAALALDLRERFAQERLGITASSLTFTTLIALVPLFTVVLAIFTAFPAFTKLESGLEQWLTQSLFPDSISRQVMGHLSLFASKASRLGAMGFVFFVFTALSLVLTIDRILNVIWHTPKVRPLAQRVLVYWAVISLAPLFLAGSLVFSASAAQVAQGLTGAGSATVRSLFAGGSVLLTAFAFAALFRFVPNAPRHAPVRWWHAYWGGLWVALGLALAKAGLSAYLRQVPSLSVVYGAFATVPILLLWVYVVWMVVLSGAVIAAYLHTSAGSLSQKLTGKYTGNGGAFALAIDVLALIELGGTPHKSRLSAVVGFNQAALHQHLHAGDAMLDEVLRCLQKLDWLGQLEDGRFVALRPLSALNLTPLAQALWLPHGADLAAQLQAHALCDLSLQNLRPALSTTARLA